ARASSFTNHGNSDDHSVGRYLAAMIADQEHATLKDFLHAEDFRAPIISIEPCKQSKTELCCFRMKSPRVIIELIQLVSQFFASAPYLFIDGSIYLRSDQTQKHIYHSPFSAAFFTKMSGTSI